MGKTSFALRYIHGSKHNRIAIFDHQSEFASRLEIPPEKVAVDSMGFIRLLETERVVPFDFSVNWPGYKEEAFVYFCDLVYDVAKFGLEPKGLDCLFICDELQQFVNAAQSPVEFKQILETGRRFNLDSLTLSRAPNRLNTSTREEFTELILFRLDDINSLKFAEGVGANVAEVQSLSPHEFLYYNVIRGGERRGKVEFREKSRV